jgi:hypothetical protein
LHRAHRTCDCEVPLLTLTYTFATAPWYAARRRGRTCARHGAYLAPQGEEGLCY